MKESGIDPNIHTYSIIIDGLCKSGRLKNAKEIFEDLSIKGYRPDVKTYTIMINGLCKEGLLHEALAFLSKMEDNGCLPDAVTYEIIIGALFEKELSRICFCCNGSTSEETRTTSVLELLKIAVEGIGSMVFQSVWIIAWLVHLDFATICTSTSTSPIQRCLQLIVAALRISYAPLLIFSKHCIM
ncbi:hypothetical protein AHAS_Ahas17G0007400 [Arachis hypogaea]